jgi:hypothetical protein
LATIQFAHRDDEHVLVSELRAAVDAYSGIAEQALVAG